MPPVPDSAAPFDLHLACFADVRAWGGGLTVARALHAAASRAGLRALILGVESSNLNLTAAPPADDARNVPVVKRRLLWRVQSWQTVAALVRRARRLPPPGRAFVALSPFWVVAARRAWPAARIIFPVPCLLANCLPFCWPGRRPTGFWQRLDFAGIRRVEHRACEAADLAVVPTTQAYYELREFHPSVADRLIVLPRRPQTARVPPEVGLERRRSLGLAPDAFLLLAAGVCDRNKAFDAAVRALPACDPRVHLAIVGAGPERAALGRLAAALGQERRVHLLGPRADLGPWYAAADAVVSTSFYDMFPNVILEAAQHGRPAIVPAHDPPHVYAGTAGLVAAGGGLLYDRRQPATLASAIDRLVAQPQLARLLGQRAQVVVQDIPTSDEWLAQVLGLCPAPRARPGPPAARPAPARECVHVA